MAAQAEGSVDLEPVDLDGGEAPKAEAVYRAEGAGVGDRERVVQGVQGEEGLELRSQKCEGAK